MGNPGHRFSASLTGIVIIGLVTACGAGSSADDSGETSDPYRTSSVRLDSIKPNRDAIKLLPADINESGTLTLGTSLQWPPFGYETEKGSATGVDILMMRAVARSLDLELDITNTKFPSIIPGVQSGRFDVGANELSDTPERRDVVRFVDYMTSSDTLMVRRSDQIGDLSPTKMCGHTLAATEGTTSLSIGRELSAKCVKSGKKPITFKVYSESANTILAVTSGKAEGYITGKALAIHLSQTTHQDLRALPGAVPGTTNKTALVIGKDNPELARALQAALQALVDNGTYEKILAVWRLEGQAVEKITINDAQDG